MKRKDNRNVYIGISIVFFLITVFNLFNYFSNNIKAEKVKKETSKILSDISKPNINYDKALSYQKELAEYRDKIDTQDFENAKTKIDTGELITRFCDCLSYEVDNNRKQKSENELKEPLYKFITHECIKKDIETNYAFVDDTLYYIERTVKDFVYKNTNTKNPTVFAIIKYNNNSNTGYEYTTFDFLYDETSETFKISKISVIRQKED